MQIVKVMNGFHIHSCWLLLWYRFFQNGEYSVEFISTCYIIGIILIYYNKTVVAFFTVVFLCHVTKVHTRRTMLLWLGLGRFC